MTVKTVKVYLCDVPGCIEAVSVEQGSGVPAGWSTSNTNRKHRCPDHLLIRCQQCGRKMRVQGMSAAEYPETILAYRSDPEDPLCRSCYQGRRPVENVSQQYVKFIKRLVETRLDDPDDRLLVLDQLGLLGADID